MSIFLVIHLIALGIWIGVVGAEFAIEFDGKKNDESFVRAAKLHYITDIYICGNSRVYNCVFDGGSYARRGPLIRCLHVQNCIFSACHILQYYLCVCSFQKA